MLKSAGRHVGGHLAVNNWFPDDNLSLLLLTDTKLGVWVA